MPAEGPVGVVRLIGNPWTVDRLARTVMAPFLTQHPHLDLRIVTLTPRSPLRGEATLSLWFEAEPRESEFAIKLGEVPLCGLPRPPCRRGRERRRRPRS